MLDFISWYWSRYFLHRVVQPDAGFAQAAQHIIADLCIALILLLCLCSLLPFMAEALSWGYGFFSDAAIDWRQYALDGRDDPWGKGLFITLMVITTVLPTAIHLLLALVAGALRLGGVRLGHYLRRHRDDGIRRLLAGGWFLAYWLVPPLLVLGLLWWLGTVLAQIPLAQGLYDFTLLSHSYPAITLPIVASLLTTLLLVARHCRKQPATSCSI